MLSLPKILLTLAIIAVVFYFGRGLTRRADSMMRKPGAKPDAPPDRGAPTQAVELSKCPRCGTYVGPDSPPCERPDCPQRA